MVVQYERVQHEHVQYEHVQHERVQTGLLGGARGDGDAALMDGVRVIKVTNWPGEAGIFLRVGTCRGRSIVPDPVSFDITWDDDPHNTGTTDLRPELRVETGATFPDLSLRTVMGQWQILDHIAIPELKGDEGMCPVCYMVSDEVVCPTCGRRPGGVKTRSRSTSSHTASGSGTSATTSLCIEVT